MEKQVRSEGFSDFDIHPDSTFVSYIPVLYLEPFEAKNKRAFGFDLTSEEVRRKALDFARDSGEIALSGKTTLVQEVPSHHNLGFW